MLGWCQIVGFAGLAGPNIYNVQRTANLGHCSYLISLHNAAKIIPRCWEVPENAFLNVSSLIRHKKRLWGCSPLATAGSLMITPILRDGASRANPK